MSSELTEDAARRSSHQAMRLAGAAVEQLRPEPRGQRLRPFCRLCWLCGLLPLWRGPYACSCRAMWKFGGPPEDLRDNPLGLLDPPEYVV